MVDVDVSESRFLLDDEFRYAVGHSSKLFSLGVFSSSFFLSFTAKLSFCCVSKKRLL
jgi:hypothetical protein